MLLKSTLNGIVRGYEFTHGTASSIASSTQGRTVAWFGVSRDTLRLQGWARDAANGVVYVVALMSHDGRNAK